MSRGGRSFKNAAATAARGSSSQSAVVSAARSANHGSAVVPASETTDDQVQDQRSRPELIQIIRRLTPASSTTLRAG